MRAYQSAIAAEILLILPGIFHALDSSVEESGGNVAEAAALLGPPPVHTDLLMNQQRVSS